MIRELRLFLTALQYFTRLPAPRWVGHDPADLQASMRWLPAVGVLVGAAGGAVFWAAGWFLPQVVASILSLLATVLLTGALHEDGLADCCDGLFGGRSREDALRIMKDSRLGSFGAIALILALGLKINLLIGLTVPALLIGGHALSRFCALALMASADYARDNGDSRAGAASGRPRWPGLIFALLVALAACLPAGRPALAGLVLAALAFWLLRRWFLRRLGGYTGDCLGAMQQVTELAFYLGWTAALPYLAR